MPTSQTDRMLYALAHEGERFQENWPIVAWLLRALKRSVINAPCLRCGVNLGLDSLLFRNIPYCSPACRDEAREHGDLPESAFAGLEEKRGNDRAYRSRVRSGHIPKRRQRRAA